MFNFKKTKYKKKTRITARQLNWLRKNKNTNTMAQFLEKIINYYKKNETTLRQEDIKRY